MERGLIRFWVEFSAGTVRDTAPAVLECLVPAFIGVTARDLDEAMTIARDVFWPTGDMPTPSRVTEDVDVSTIPGWCHALVGMPTGRGIWYPRQRI